MNGRLGGKYAPGIGFWDWKSHRRPQLRYPAAEQKFEVGTSEVRHVPIDLTNSTAAMKVQHFIIDVMHS